MVTRFFPLTATAMIPVRQHPSLIPSPRIIGVMEKITVPEKFAPVLADVSEYVREHPGCTRSELAAMVHGSNGSITFAVSKLIADGHVVQRARRRLWPAPQDH